MVKKHNDDKSAKASKNSKGKPSKGNKPSKSDETEKKIRKVRDVIPGTTGINAVHHIKGRRTKGDVTGSIERFIWCEAGKAVRVSLYLMKGRKTARLEDFQDPEKAHSFVDLVPTVVMRLEAARAKKAKKAKNAAAKAAKAAAKPHENGVAEPDAEGEGDADDDQQMEDAVEQPKDAAENAQPEPVAAAN
jgi:hypothetical protein